MTNNKPVITEKLKKRLYPEVLKLFSQKDFHQVNIREISNTTGISTGTIYKYYTSKEDLLFSIIDEKLGEIGDLIRLHISGMKDSREMFRKIFWVTMDFFDKNPELAIVAFITVPLKNFMKSPAYRRQTETDIMNEVVETAKHNCDVAREIDNPYFTDFYFMISHRHIHNWYSRGMTYSLAETITDFFDFFWKMVEPRPTADNTK